MKWSFLKFYFALLLSMITLALGIEGVLSWHSGPQIPWLPAHLLFCEKIPLPACDRDAVGFQQLPVSAVSLPAETRQQLASGDVVALNTRSGIATLIAQNGDNYLSYGPVDLQDDNRDLALYLYLLFFGLFALLLLFWLWPLFRDLDHVRATLASADQRKGVLRFALPKRSLMQPLARVITQLSSEVEQLLHSQREMSHFIAHDLRTPLARMRFALAMLKTEQADLKQDLIDNISALEQVAQEYLRYAEDEANHSVLSLTRLSTDSFFADLTQRFRHAGPIPIAIDFPKQAHFHADAFGLERAIDNLINNAQRFAKQQIRIRLQHRHGCCVLQIDDDGPGIPLAARQVFGRSLPFERQRVRGDREQGFGIGLYIVRRVAMLHRGRLKLLSSPLGGARFELVWPDAP
ncbi:hypothetical protein HPT27_00525 [Permianibacter sp. IMCC34836]|uniref:ATP-binding protein n=1 Tax=Permianibacter fluminis TaxID=2738515 RepID=UPI0015579CFF|nr:ATP-binding protein [Permianibacter fluminis]NQD35486.1 hypothetical protein [Permianibacter fluminis]